MGFSRNIMGNAGFTSSTVGTLEGTYEHLGSSLN